MQVARDCMGSVPEASYRAMMLALLGFDQRKALGDIAVPTLVLSGSRDKNSPAPMMAKMATYIPSSTYVEIEAAGHLVNLEQPKAFDGALEHFLNTVRVTA
jgi:3-oxoadipate enol-lactonase